MIVASISADDYWWIALTIGLVAALVVAALLALLIQAVVSIDRSVRGLARDRRCSRRQHGEHPATRCDRPGAGADRRRGGRPGRLHERAHGRLRRRGMSVGSTEAASKSEGGGSADARSGELNQTHFLVLLSVVLAVVVVVVLASALIVVRLRLESISKNLATLGGALQGVESEHLRPLEPAGHRHQSRSSTSSSAPCPASPARQRSSPNGDRDDALVDRRRDPARRPLPRRRLPAARRAQGRQEHRPQRAPDRDGRGSGIERTSTLRRCS